MPKRAMRQLLFALLFVLIVVPVGLTGALESSLENLKPATPTQEPIILARVAELPTAAQPVADVPGGDQAVVPAPVVAPGNLTMQAKFDLFRSLGASTPEAILGTALCTAENRDGNPNAINQNRGAPPDYGICQVNGMHVPALAPSVQALLDPVTNARASLSLLRSGGPKLWCTYPGGCGGQPGVADWATIFARATALAAGAGD